MFGGILKNKLAKRGTLYGVGTSKVLDAIFLHAFSSIKIKIRDAGFLLFEVGRSKALDAIFFLMCFFIENHNSF